MLERRSDERSIELTLGGVFSPLPDAAVLSFPTRQTSSVKQLTVGSATRTIVFGGSGAARAGGENTPADANSKADCDFDPR